jgi:cytochrome c
MQKCAMLAAALLTLSACGRSGGDAANAGPPSGERLFSACAICHTVAPPDTPAGKMRLIGPNLFGIYGKPSAHLPDFAYSKAMRNANLIWDDATLDQWIANPQKLAPGNRMAFAGEPDAAKRAAIIEYLKTLN